MYALTGMFCVIFGADAASYPVQKIRFQTARPLFAVSLSAASLCTSNTIVHPKRIRLKKNLQSELQTL